MPGIGIADLLIFVAGKTNFMKAFAHVLGRYIKKEAAPRHILSCVVAMGTNMGLWKMAEVSGLGHSALTTRPQLPAGRDDARRQRCHLESHRGPVHVRSVRHLSLIHISEPTRLGMISYAV